MLKSVKKASLSTDSLHVTHTCITIYRNLIVLLTKCNRWSKDLMQSIREDIKIYKGSNTIAKKHN